MRYRSLRRVIPIAAIALFVAVEPGFAQQRRRPRPTTIAPTTLPATTLPAVQGDARMVRIEANLAVTPAQSFFPTIDSAKTSGANTIVFSDTKSNIWFANKPAWTGWLTNMKAIRDFTRSKGMKFVLQTAPTGYGTPLLYHDPNLTTGYPLVNVPMQVQGAKLVPVQTGSIVNGSFEQVGEPNRPSGWSSQDAPGLATFIDSSQAIDGNSSMRFENGAAANSSAMARAFTQLTVHPQQQYALRFFVKTNSLSADYIGPYVAGATGRSLTKQHHSIPATGGTREFVSSPKNWTTGWTEMVIPFNSEDQTSVTVAFGVWGHRNGTMWIDNIRVESTPTLNLVRRNSLPLTITSQGRTLTEGIDTGAFVDPLLGQIGYAGYYDTYHAAPSISVPTGSSLQEGDTILLSGYHAQLTMSGQAGVSWQEPAVFDLIKRVHAEAAAEDLADGYLIDFEEVRTGGWEPADKAAGGSAASLGKHAERIFRDAAIVTGKPIYAWNDMLDPTQNAVDDFYHVKGSLTGVWNYVSSDAVIIINWKDQRSVTTTGSASVAHFERLGFTQIAGAFYDEPVEANYLGWKAALDGRRNIAGSMYTTWVDDFSQLSVFGQLWWR
jgi:hypothetical protein